MFRGTYGVLRPKKRKVRGIPGPEMAQFKEASKEPAKPKARTAKKEKAPEVKEEAVQEEIVQEVTHAAEQKTAEAKEEVVQEEAPATKVKQEGEHKVLHVHLTAEDAKAFDKYKRMREGEEC